MVEYNYNQAKPIFKEKPIWANYVAQHPNGELWYYQQAPTIVNKYGWKNDENQFGSDVFSNPNKWDKTYYKIDKDCSIR